MPPLGAAAIAAIIGAVVSAGTGVASAVMSKKGGGDSKAIELNPDQQATADRLANQFSFGTSGQPLNPSASLGQNLLTPPGSNLGPQGFGTAQHLSQRFKLGGQPNTNRFTLGQD